MITPTARSMALPLTANSLNSFHMSLISSDDDDVDQFFRNDNHIAHRLTGDPLLDVRVRQRGGFQFFLRRHDRHLHSIAKFAVYLNNDFNFVLDKQTFVISWPGLFRDISARVAKFRV